MRTLYSTAAVSPSPLFTINLDIAIRQSIIIDESELSIRGPMLILYLAGAQNEKKNVSIECYSFIILLRRVYVATAAAAVDCFLYVCIQSYKCATKNTMII